MAEPTADQKQQSGAQGQQHPPLLAGKYKDEAALDAGYGELVKTLGLDDAAQTTFENTDQKVKAYKAMEAVLGQRKKPEDKPAAGQDQKPVTDLNKGIGDDIDIGTILTSAGLKDQDVADAWNNEGKLTEEQYAALKKVNPLFSRKLVDQFFSGQAAQAKTIQQRQTDAKASAIKIAGGENELKTVLEFAKTQTDAADLDKGLNGFDTYEKTMQAIMFRYNQAVGAGKAKPLINGGSAAGPTTGFGSVEEYMASIETARKNGGWSEIDKAKMAINGAEMGRRASMGTN